MMLQSLVVYVKEYMINDIINYFLNKIGNNKHCKSWSLIVRIIK